MPSLAGYGTVTSKQTLLRPFAVDLKRSIVLTRRGKDAGNRRQIQSGETRYELKRINFLCVLKKIRNKSLL
ncbi:hypothetical protein RB195_001168 [Necator americanus]|uniref:Uncharacterized protein n=1 Tax=Necator americanus TaxID=51031 RepID=A0ABR1DEB8_NECAM